MLNVISGQHPLIALDGPLRVMNSVPPLHVETSQLVTLMLQQLP